VILAVFYMECFGVIGTAVAACEHCRAGHAAGMLCRESVGFFATARAASGFRGQPLVFGAAARAVEAADYRADFGLPAVLVRDPDRAGRLDA
jgi:hypothetical protein